MAERLRRYENQENQLDRMVAPCHSLILPLGKFYSCYFVELFVECLRINWKQKIVVLELYCCCCR